MFRGLRLRVMIGAMAIPLLLLLAASPNDANAVGQPCEVQTCLARSEEYGIRAVFVVGGIWSVSLDWNYISSTYYYARPINGPGSVDLTWVSHAQWSTYTWPRGTWQVGTNTWLQGYRGDWLFCNPDCTIFLLGLGWNQWSSDYDYYNVIYWNVRQYPTCWFACKIKVSMAVFPSDGASDATNHTRSTCKRPTPTGTTGC
jgi:hypothetical protein